MVAADRSRERRAGAGRFLVPIRIAVALLAPGTGVF